MNRGQFQWQDLFVMVDDGAIPAAGYATLERTVRDQAKLYPGGVAILCILPPEAKPPPDDVKRFVKAALGRLAPSISCLGYVIEGIEVAQATKIGDVMQKVEIEERDR